MDIAYVVQRYLPAPLSGSERYIQHLAEYFSRKNAVTVLTSDAYDWNAFWNPFKRRIPVKMEINNRVRVVRFHVNYGVGSSFFALGYFLRSIGVKIDFVNLLSQGPFMPAVFFHILGSDYELVHATSFPLVHVWLAWLSCKKADIPLIITPFIHVDEEVSSRYCNRHLFSVLKGSNAVIAMTETEKKWIISWGVKPERVHVVPMGIDAKRWRICSGDRFREKHGLSDEELIVLFVGAKRYDKGAVHLLKAMEIVQKRFKNVVLVAAGPRRKEWTRAKEAVKLSGVIDLEWINGQEKMDMFDACDVFVMPSRADSFGIVYLEAWARGKPVVAAKAGAMPDVVRNEVDGLLVEFGDVKGIADAVTSLLKDERLRERLGNAGRRRVVEEHDWSIIGEKTKEVYEKAVKG